MIQFDETMKKHLNLMISLWTGSCVENFWSIFET